MCHVLCQHCLILMHYCHRDLIRQTFPSLSFYWPQDFVYFALAPKCAKLRLGSSTALAWQEKILKMPPKPLKHLSGQMLLSVAVNLLLAHCVVSTIFSIGNNKCTSNNARKTIREQMRKQSKLETEQTESCRCL